MTHFVRLPLPSFPNARDMGGIPTRDGRVTRWGRLLRTSAPDHITDSDLRWLLERYPLRLALDLRLHDEVEQHPSRLAGLPGVTALHASFLDIPVPFESMDDLPAMYRAILDHAQPALSRVFMALDGMPPDGCALFHCSAGKDRTGLLAALILGVCGVGETDIIVNYEVSYACLHAVYEKLAGQGVTFAQNLMASRPEYMREALHHIKDAHGGMDAYLQALGVDDAMRARLRERWTQQA